MNIITKKEFQTVFMLSKKEIFEVNYYTLGSNPTPHFSTSAAVFNQPKTDYNRCGQCQDDVLKGHNAAMNFYKKWDSQHLKQLTEGEYQDLLNDMEILFSKYPYILKEQEPGKELRGIPFWDIKDFSMTVYRKVTPADGKK